MIYSNRHGFPQIPDQNHLHVPLSSVKNTSTIKTPLLSSRKHVTNINKIWRKRKRSYMAFGFLSLPEEGRENDDEKTRERKKQTNKSRHRKRIKRGFPFFVKKQRRTEEKTGICQRNRRRVGNARTVCSPLGTFWSSRQESPASSTDQSPPRPRLREKGAALVCGRGVLLCWCCGLRGVGGGKERGLRYVVAIKCYIN